jgi:hypothetical protein
MTIPVSHTRRARSMEQRLGPAEPPKPGPRIPHITRLMALAIKLQEMIDRGEIHDYVDIARLGCITRARASQIMNLTLLAPDIQEQLLEVSDQAAIKPAMTEKDLRSVAKLVSWTTQRAAWTGRQTDTTRRQQTPLHASDR